MAKKIVKHYGISFTNSGRWIPLFSIHTTGKVETKTIFRIGSFEFSNYCTHTAY